MAITKKSLISGSTAAKSSTTESTKSAKSNAPGPPLAAKLETAKFRTAKFRTAKFRTAKFRTALRVN